MAIPVVVLRVVDPLPVESAVELDDVEVGDEPVVEVAEPPDVAAAPALQAANEPPSMTSAAARAAGRNRSLARCGTRL